MSELNQEIAPGVWLRVDTANELANFLTMEIQRWERLLGAQTRYPVIRDRVVQAQVRRINNMLTENAAAAAQQHWPALLDSSGWFSGGRRGARALCSLIPADAAALQLIDSDPDAAVLGASARQREEDTISLVGAAEHGTAILALERFSAAGAGREAHTESFKALHDLVDKTQERWKKEMTAAVKEAENATLEAQAKSEALDTQKTAHAQAHDDMVQNHKNVLKAIEEQFLSQMVLRAPVQYWKDRASASQRAATIWLWVFISAAIGLFGVVLWQGPGLLSLLKDKNDQISLAAVPLLLAALVPLLWVLRHMARMFADNIADARDATQRASLTSTFLSLATQESVKFSDTERAIIIQALFRPSPAQPADDGVPVPLLELLKR